MIRKRNIIRMKIIFMLGLFGMGALFTIVGPSSGISSMNDYCSLPPFLSNTLQPNVLVVLDNSLSMNTQAYSSSYNPSQFTKGHYYGYFEPDRMYVYSSNNRWEITTANLSTATAAHPIASGDFLNWATMRRVDIAKKLLIGGKADPRVPAGTTTVKLYGEDSPEGGEWDFTKQFDNTSAPGLISPFQGNYSYKMTGSTLYVSPIVQQSNTFTVRPNANISVPSSWTVTGAPSAWEAVDEVSQDGNSSYIQNRSTKDPTIFDYNYSGGNVGTITGITVHVYAKKSSRSSTMDIQAVLQLGGVNSPSATIRLSGTSYDHYSYTWSVNPATGAAWQWSDIKSGGPAALNGFGVMAYTQPTSTNYPSVTQTYMEISSSTPSGGPYNIIIDQGTKKAEGIIDHLSSSVRFGLAFYNQEVSGRGNQKDGGHIANYVDFGSTAGMITNINDMVPATYTPLAETLYEMVRYFRQDDPYYSGSPVDYTKGRNYDPYYYKYSTLAGSGLGDQYVPCAKSFILMLTDGESTMDQNIPSTLRDYDKDRKDPGNYDVNGTDYLDDVALWARTQDHRADLAGPQNIYIYTVFMFGRGSQLLKDAAINGGFNDLNGDGVPGPDLRESRRDSNNDGTITTADLPLTYYEGDDGYALETSITNAIGEILKRSASGTAVSVLTTSSRGVGSLIQAYFLPALQQGLREVAWTGYLQNLWLDPDDNLREDTTNDYKLILSDDNVLKFYFDDEENETKAATFTTDADGTGGTLQTCNPATKKFSDVNYLWEAGKKLALRQPSDRKIFTSTKVMRNEASGTTTTTLPTSDCGFGSMFSPDNVSCFKVSTVTGNDTLKNSLNPDATYSAEDIVRYIRGECRETGVSGDNNCGNTAGTTFRDRRVSVSGGAANGNIWKLGDILNSTPKVFANAPLNTYHIDYSDASYYGYISGAGYKQKSSVAFVGSNDGMLHAFRVGHLKDTGLAATIKALFKNFFATGDDDPDRANRIGEEMWAYVPFNAFPYLKYLADPNYCHIYYSDLSVRLVDASTGGDAASSRTEASWKTILIGGMRFGGACSGTDAHPSGPPISGVGFSSYFAIDVTDPETPVPLWEFSDADMGYSTTYPSIIRTGDSAKNGNWYVAFGSGSKVLPKGGVDIGRNSTGYIYILDLKTGALVQKIDLHHNAIVGDILAVDANRDYRSEKIYFGTSYFDSSNRVWKGKVMSIAIPNQDLSTWSPSSTDMNILFDGNYPFTSSPDAVKDKAGKVWIYIGSGKYYSDIDRIDTSNQIFFGMKDTGNLVSESSLSSPGTTTGTVQGTTQVCAYSSSDKRFGLRDVATSVDASPPSAATVGWKIPLTNGERVISRPFAIGGIVDFLTFKPDSDICKLGGSSSLYALGYTSGAAPAKVAIIAPGSTSTASGGNVIVGDNVTVRKSIPLGPGAPPMGEAIIVPPPKENGRLKKKIQIATGVIVEAENQSAFSVVSKIVHRLKK